MENKNQLLGPGKQATENEPGKAKDLPFSPDWPITRSIDAPASSPDHPITRPPDPKELLAEAAHRLAQPLTALRGGLELGLMGKHTVVEFRSLLEQSLQLADNMARIIVSLRDAGEPGASGGPAQGVLLEAAVAEVLAEFEGLAHSHDIRLQLKAEGAAKVAANPERLREALQNLLAWVIQNSAGGGAITVELAEVDGEARLFLSPPRLDLQYLQIKVLEDITSPGSPFFPARRDSASGWADHQRLWAELRGKVEILSEGPAAGCIRVRFPLAPAV